MTLVQGNTNDGGAGTGSDGHRCYVSYTYSQSVSGNYTDVTWSYGVDYGDPNYWNSITNRSVSVTYLSPATGMSYISGDDGGAGVSSAPAINTSNPGYGGQSHDFWSGVERIYHNSNGQGSFRINASMTFPSPGYTSSITNYDVSLPNIVRPPSAPTSLTATRVNDGQINLSWTNNSGTYTAYSSVKVYRSTNGGSYALIATLGVVTSYSDTTTSANNKYTYKVQAVNAAGTADSSASSAVFTTPGAPSGLDAAKQAGGNIRVTWTNNVNYTEYQTDIYESQNGGAYSYVDSVATGVTQWDHVSPSTSVTHKYKALTNKTSSSLYSAYSNESSTITLLSTANAPTGLSPSGVAKDAAEDIVLTWTHNPADGTPQSKRRVQYKVDGGSYSDLVNDSSTTSSYTISGGTLSNGHTITWKAATAGENGTLSSYSSEASFTTSARPTVAIDDLSDYPSSALTAGWGYFQAQSSTQATWRAYLYDASDVLLESKSGTTESSVTFSKALTDATTYKVQVYVTSAAGLESLVDTETFTTDFLPPATSYIVATYDDDSGTMNLAVSADGPEEDVSVEITSMDIQRKINDGDWVTLISGVVFDGSAFNVVDYIPSINGTNTYRVVAYSATPTSNYSAEAVEVVAEPNLCFLNAGTSFATYAKLKAQPQIQAKTSRAKALYHFAGRTKPVQLTGEAQSLTLSVSGMLIGSSSTPEEFEEMAYTDGVVCWRDPTGRRIFASIGDVTTNRTTHVFSNVSFGLTELDYDE